MGDVIEILTTATNTVEVEAQGPQGIPGVGVPTGGSTGQVLRKASAADYATEWAAAGSGSGSVTSVALASSHLTITGSPITDSGTITANLASATLASLALADSASQPGHTHTASEITDFTAAVEAVSPPADWDTLTNKPASFTPSAHKASHATGGTDALAPSDIGAQSIFVTEALGTVTANVTLTAARAKIYTLNTTTSGLRILLPASDVLAGDIVQIRFTSSTGQSLTPVRGSMTGFFTGDIGPAGGPVTFIAASASGTSWDVAPVDRHAHGNIGDQGNIGTTSGLPVKTGASGVLEAGVFGTSAGQFAEGNHTHGNLTSDGKLGSTAGLPVVTGTAGAVTTLALGAAGTVLTVNSGANGVEFAAASGGGVTGAAPSASDVLGVSGANITGVDAGSADRLVFWDDSAGKLTHLSLGSNALSIDGTTLKSQALFPVEPISRGATYIPYIGSSSNGNSSAAVNTGNGFVLFSPIYIRKSANYTTFSVIVSAAGSASSLGKMALYTIKASDATPDALVCESGTFTTDSTGIKQPTMASTFVSEGWYYMAIGTNSTTNVTFWGDTMLLLRGVFSGAALNTNALLLDYSQKLYANFWPNPWDGTGNTFRTAFHPITSLS